MSSFIHDARYAVRYLVKNPIFALTAVVSLGLGIGANTALFGIFNSLLWKPLPVPEPQDIVRIYAKGAARSYLYQNFSYPEHLDYCSRNDALSGIAASTGLELAFRASGGDPTRMFGEVVSDNYFDLLGVKPHLGRVLASRSSGGMNVSPDVVLSYRLWRRRFDSNPAVIGQTIWLSNRAFTIVGVAQPDFRGTSNVSVFAPDLWLPLGTMAQLDAAGQDMFHNRKDRSLQLIGRLKPGVSAVQAEAALRTIAAASSAIIRNRTGAWCRWFFATWTRDRKYTAPGPSMSQRRFSWSLRRW